MVIHSKIKSAELCLLTVEAQKKPTLDNGMPDPFGTCHSYICVHNYAYIIMLQQRKENLIINVQLPLSKRLNRSFT